MFDAFRSQGVPLACQPGGWHPLTVPYDEQLNPSDHGPRRWTGNAEESLGWLERAYAISPEGEDFRVIASGLYDKVRNDPRFMAGLERVRSQIYQRVQRARIAAGGK